MNPREFWSVGDYATVGELWADAARQVIGLIDPVSLDVVDLACGTGAAALAAANRGARSVTGVDITPELLAEAERRSIDRDVEVTWLEADVQALPLADDCADVTVSTFGIVFASDPGAALTEARRITRPGGLVAFTSWDGNGSFAELRRTLARYMPDPLPDPWHESPSGIEATAGLEARIESLTVMVEADSAEDLVARLETDSSPIILAAKSVGAGWPAARGDLVELFARWGRHVDDRFVVPVDFLLTRINVPTA